MKYICKFHGKTVFFFCEDTLKETAEFFASILQKEDAGGRVIRDGAVLQIGWGFYHVRRTEAGYQIMACGLLGDPFREVTEDLSLSLEIFAEQRRVLNVTKAVPRETSFQDTLVVQRAAVKAPRVYLQRCEPGNPDDSGWYMGVLGGNAPEDPGEYARVYTYQLLGFCKEALSVMQLPVGTVCVFENGRLVEAADRDNRKIL